MTNSLLLLRALLGSDLLVSLVRYMILLILARFGCCFSLFVGRSGSSLSVCPCLSSLTGVMQELITWGPPLALNTFFLGSMIYAVPWRFGEIVQS